jgi:hypothetical protein
MQNPSLRVSVSFAIVVIGTMTLAAQKPAGPYYWPSSQDRPALTLTANSANSLALQTGQNVTFKLAWSRTVPAGVFTYQFNWGDGTWTTVTNTVFSRSFSVARVYTVEVNALPAATAKNAKANVYASSNTVSIVVRAPANVELVPNSTSAISGDVVHFQATLNAPTPAVRYVFDFGDKTPPVSGSSQISHPYATVGDFPARVTVFLEDQSSVQSAPVTISVTSPVASANSSSGNNSGRTSQQVTSPQLSVALAKNVQPITGSQIGIIVNLTPSLAHVHYQINWGDGPENEDLANSQPPSHVYSAPGSYTIMVTAKRNPPFDPPLMESLPLTIASPAPPRSAMWPIVAVGIAAAAVIGCTLWFALRAPDTPVDLSPLVAAHETNSNLAQQKFRYIFSEGLSRHEIKMKRGPESFRRITMSSGMRSTEHTIIFPGETTAFK